MIKVFLVKSKTAEEVNDRKQPIYIRFIRPFVVINAFCLLCGGFFCVFLDHYLFAYFYSWIKMCIYTLLSINLTFGFTWTVYEIIRNHRQISQWRFMFTLINATITGIVTGVIFGFLDTLADEQYEKYGQFLVLQMTSMPLSIFLAAAVNGITTRLPEQHPNEILPSYVETEQEL